MNSTYFRIQNFQEDSYFVTILSTEMSSVYWAELIDALIELEASEKTIYFDFILRNGISDRFYVSKTDRNYSIVSDVRKCQATHNLSLIADSFFAENLTYVERSVMPQKQKAIYYKRLALLNK